MKPKVKKYLRHNCLYSLLFTLFCIGTIQTAAGDICSGDLVSSCKSISFVAHPTTDCVLYYETRPSGAAQCKRLKTTHKCIADAKKPCTIPPESK